MLMKFLYWLVYLFVLQWSHLKLFQASSVSLPVHNSCAHRKQEMQRIHFSPPLSKRYDWVQYMHSSLSESPSALVSARTHASRSDSSLDWLNFWTLFFLGLLILNVGLLFLALNSWRLGPVGEFIAFRSPDEAVLSIFLL